MTTLDVFENPTLSPIRNPYLEANFAPVAEEITAFDLPVSGAIPKDLNGRLLRIGPNPVGPVDPRTYHWFTGAGMAHGVRLSDGKAEWYRNRFVLSEAVAHALGHPAFTGPGNGPRDFSPNTNIIDIGGRTYAIVEAGALPVELTDELDSVTRSNLAGTLHRGFSAHPKFDPVTGELHVLTYEPGLPVLSYLTVDAAGLAHRIADIAAPHQPMVHDVAFTATKIIVLDLPVTFDPQLLGREFPFAWNPKQTPRIGLLPRSGDLAGLRWIAAPECYVFHVMNAFDDGDTVIIDVVRHPRMFDRERRGPDEGAPRLVRWRIDMKNGRLSEIVLEERGCEFPRFNDAFAGRAYRYGYTSGVHQGQLFGPTFKHDLCTGQTEMHDYGPGRMAQEPVFVARDGANAEDDGWVLSYVHDATRNACDVVILDAQNFAGDPVAAIHLPVRVPFGFHGNWLPDRA
jgi:carotenoid cleavage dioxygenase